MKRGDFFGVSAIICLLIGILILLSGYIPYKLWNKHAKTFMASICIDGKNKNLGYFIDQVDAAKEYDKAAKKVFGEFAYLNFPND